MKIIIVNNTSDDMSYVSGLVLAPAYSSTEIAPGLWERMYSDLAFLRDLRNSNIILNDGVTTYRYPDTETLVRDAIDRLDFSAVKKDFSYSTTQTNASIWTPTSGKKFVITDYIISIRNNTLGAITITIFDDTNITGNIIYKHTIDAGGNYDSGKNLTTPIASSGIDKILKITTSGNLTVSGFFNGYETE